jgi:actin-related protein 3
MGPEIFFRPQLVDGKWNKGIHTHVDDMIQMCPIDIRRNLYSQIVLSGGSTAMSGLQERMESEITQIVRERQAANQMKTGHKALDVEVKVHKNEREANSVFYGASKMASKVNFAYWPSKNF